MAAAAPRPRPWQVQAMEAREKEKILSSMENKLGDLFKACNDLSGMTSLSEAEREAKMAKVRAEGKALMREYNRVAAEIKTPDYSSMTEDERAAEGERVRQEALEALRLKRKGGNLKIYGGGDGGGFACSRYVPEGKKDVHPFELRFRLLDFDPKQGGEYYTRSLYYEDLRVFDIDEESPLGPMRYTNEVYKDYKLLCEGINIYSVKISRSDVDFPIHVYGTVIARDCTDRKCIHLFRRDRDHCQTINSEDESLLLAGPKRGLTLLDDDYIETDLKIKDHQGKDRELSKGFLTIRGVGPRSLDKCVVETKSLDTRLSTVDVVYGFVLRAVEGTIAIEVIQGCFDGQITAHTTSIQNRIVLSDRELYGETTSNGTGVIQLMRPVVSVFVMDMLVIVAQTRDGKYERKISFTPRMNGAEQDDIWVGGAEMRVKVTWSIMRTG